MSAANKGTGSKGAGSAAKSKGSHQSKPSRAGSKKRVMETDLLASGIVTPDDVLSLERATEGERLKTGRGEGSFYSLKPPSF